MNKAKVDSARRRMARIDRQIQSLHSAEFPFMFNIRREIELTEKCLAAGQEMVEHGATYDDFEGYEWIASLLNVKPTSLWRRLVSMPIRFLFDQKKS